MGDPLSRFRVAMSDAGQADPSDVTAIFAKDAEVKLCFPFETLDAVEFWDNALAPLIAAMPDLERREWISMSGNDDAGAHWIGIGGHYLGTFASPWLGMPPTGRLAHMRFHEFFRIEAGLVVEMQAIWDIPELMMQAGAWPMVPSLGREFLAPGPATCDGLGPHEGDGAAARTLVMDMLVAMGRHPRDGGPEVMEMERFWHPRFTWYGPAGIGTARGIEGFRRAHQIPFLAAMPDRGYARDQITHHFIGQGNYVGVTGWPNMKQTLSDPGWLGLPGVGREITLRSLDFWRLEGPLIRENWVLVDLLSMYDQIGVDVFARMHAMTSGRS